ncbi:MAG: hypothetical protein ACO3UM_10550 [Planctomycetota bacterium]
MLRLPLFATLIGLATPLASQRPPSFVPAPAHAAAASVDHIGKMLWFVEAGQLHAFSAATRAWVTVPVSPTATIRDANDWLLIVDGAFVAAMSAARGVFDVVPVSANATVLNAVSARNDGIILVLDGGTLWSFSGFQGRWTAQPVSPTALITVQRNVAILAEGTQLRGMSALADGWVTQTSTAPIAAVGAADTAGWATDGIDGFGFSAIQARWARTALPSAAPIAPQATRDAVLWLGSHEAAAFSGVRGTFGRSTVPPGSTATFADHWVHVVDPTGTSHRMFSVPNADWTTLSTSPSASLQQAEAVGLFVEPGRVVGYSALLSSVAARVGTVSATAVNATLAAVTESGAGTPVLFSAMSGNWTAAPQGVDARLPVLARNGALLLDTQGQQVFGFTPRGDRFTARSTSARASLHSNSGSSVLAVEDDAHLAVFEPRRGVWIESSLTPADRPLDLRIWRTVLVAAGNQTAFGYSASSGTLERTTFTGRLLETRASSEVGAWITDTEILAFSAVPDLHTDAQFPEFRRMFGRGATLDLHAHGPAGALIGAVSGFSRSNPLVIPGLGEFVLDPSSLIPVPMGSLDTDGTTVLHLPVPDLPQLRSLELGFQAVVLPTVGLAYLTQASSLRIH